MTKLKVLGRMLVAEVPDGKGGTKTVCVAPVRAAYRPWGFK